MVTIVNKAVCKTLCRLVPFLLATSVSVFAQTDDTANSPPELPLSIAEEATSRLIGVDDMEEIRAFNRHIKEFQRVKAEPLHPKKIEKRTIIVDNNTNSIIPSIRVFNGYNTTFTVVDSLGNPWPIIYATPGNAKAFPVTPLAGIPHIVNLSTVSHFVPSNITFMLKGRIEPITFTLRNDGHTVDYSLKVMVPGISPSAPRSEIPGNLPNIPLINDPAVGEFLDNNPPADAIVLPMTGPETTQAWLWRNKTVIRSRDQVIDTNNALIYEARTPDKYWTVYFLGEQSPVVQIIKSDGSTDYIILLYGEENYQDGIDNRDNGESFIETVEYARGD